MKKIIIFSSIILIILIVFLIFPKKENKEEIHYKNQETIEVKDIEEQKIMEEIENESITNNIENDNEDIKSNRNDVHSTNKSNMEIDYPNNSNVVKNNSKELESKKEESITIQPVEEIKEPQKEETTWEKLGISEDDYYNKPMWNWAKIDFNVNDYGSQEATEEACQKKGWELYEEGYAFSCTNVLSYSGKYLGEYLKTY